MKTKSLTILENAALPPVQARAILEVMETEFATDSLATKTDLLAMKADLLAMKADFKAEFATKADMAGMESRLMRWMFLFWMGQMAVTVGLVFEVSKLLK